MIRERVTILDIGRPAGACQPLRLGSTGVDSYHGPAILVTDGGPQIPVIAILEIQPRAGVTGWRGVLIPPSGVQVLGLSEGRLRLQNGAQAAFARDEGAVELSGSFQQGWLQISGEGEPPF